MLEIAYSRPFLVGFGGIFPVTSHVILTPKRHLLVRKHVVWATKCVRCASATVWPVQRIKKKSQVFYFVHLGRTPRHTDLPKNLNVGSCPGHNHVSQISEWVAAILQGVEISIFLLIFEWPLQQCSATALPVIMTRCSWCQQWFSYQWTMVKDNRLGQL